MISALQSIRAKHGNETEAFVATLNEACARAGVGWLDKVPTNMRVIGRVGPAAVKAVFVQKAIADFVGVLRGGRAVAVEVKRVEVTISKRTRTPLPPSLSLSRVEPHQREYLDRVEAAGGLALLLVVHGPLAAYAVPWSEARAVLANGGGVLSGVFLEAWRVRAGEAYLERFVEREIRTGRARGVNDDVNGRIVHGGTGVPNRLGFRWCECLVTVVRRSVARRRRGVTHARDRRRGRRSSSESNA